MCSKELLLLACLGLLGGLRLTSTTTTTTFVAAMSIANQDLERYFRSANATQTLATMTEDRIAMDVYTFAYLNYSYMSSEGIQKDVVYTEEKARYGEGKIFNVKGKLVHITDAEDSKDDTACSANLLGTRGDPTPVAGVPWIALVRRGRCTFEEKVKNVHAKGAAGVIIYNDKPVSNLEKMQIKGKSRNITAVITYQEIGVEMAQIVDQGSDMIAAIIEGHSGMRPINSLNRTSVLFVSISFIVLMVISLVWLIFYYIQRFRYLQTKDQQSRHLCSVTKKAIMKIPTKTGKSSDEKDADSDCCAICIEAYKSADCIRVLPCKHEFHKSCIDPWLIEHRTCPMCKLDVLKFYGYVFLGSEESILEYEPDRPASSTAVGGAAAAIAASAVSAAAPAFTGNGLSVASGGSNQIRPGSSSATGDGGGGVLADLIRSRDFVIDFPRIFVLDAGGAAGTRDTLFPARLPERTQSSLSLAQAHAQTWMSQMQNKLEEQHGLRRLRRKSSDRFDDMEVNLLSIRADSVKKRRSRSADGRYSHGYFGRRELRQQQQQQQQQIQIDASDPPAQPSSSALRFLTESSYAQSRQRQLEEGRSFSIRRGSEISMRQFPPPCRESRPLFGLSSPAADVAVTIQVNGEDLNLE